MPENNSPHDIFISYSRKNKDIVLQIKEEIERALGLRCWIDLSDIPCGSENFKRIVIPAIRETRIAFLFFLSAESQASEYAMKEINFARKRANKRLILVRINDDDMTDEFAFDFQDADIIDWRQPEQKAKLLRDLRTWVDAANESHGMRSSVVTCPVCGKRNTLVDTFRCRECGRENLCLRHQDEESFLCDKCAAQKAREREEAESLLEEGKRLEKADPSKSAECFRAAAELGNVEACRRYADMLRDGRGVEKNINEAVKFYQGCDVSDVWVQYGLGLCNLLLAQERDDSEEKGKEAVKWFQKSANHGLPWACVKMGDCYRDGIGVPRQDFALAASYYRHALEEKGLKTYEDHGAAQWAEYCIGGLYRDGKGVVKDLAEALKWFHMAALLESDAADPALTAAADVLAECEGSKLDWRQFRIIHGVRIRGANGRWVPLAGLVASNRGIFVGVFLDSLPSDMRNPFPHDNPAWPFAQAISQHCGIPEGCFGAALVVPEAVCVPVAELPFWVVRESNLADVMLNARVGEAPDWLGKRQDIIRKLETLPMSSGGAEKNVLIHFQAAVPEWEDGAVLLEKVEQPSRQLIRLAEQAVEELERSGKSSIADNIRTWLVKKDALKTGVVKTLILPGGAKMEMIYCAPGEFVMGSPEDEKGRDKKETQHKVKLTKGFWLGRCPITQEQWQSVMGSNPSHFKGDAHLPVENISWHDCKKFVEKVKSFAKQQLGGEARFPTEAEWEYACRAGTTTSYFWGNALNGDKANCDGRYPCGTDKKGPYREKTTPVGHYGANQWGFCDMHGNVLEWCADWYGDYGGDAIDPVGPVLGSYRVFRGGSWSLCCHHCRSAFRRYRNASHRGSNYGFRLCCSAQP